MTTSRQRRVSQHVSTYRNLERLERWHGAVTLNTVEATIQRALFDVLARQQRLSVLPRRQ